MLAGEREKAQSVEHFAFAQSRIPRLYLDIVDPWLGPRYETAADVLAASKESGRVSDLETVAEMMPRNQDASVERGFHRYRD